MAEFSITLPVRWGDMDSFGHVSNVVYLRYLEDCRAQWTEHLASDWQEGETGPVVANININYRRPLYWPGEIEITLTPRAPGRSSITIEHQIRSRPDQAGQAALYADASCTLVWINKTTGKPVPLPDSFRELI